MKQLLTLSFVLAILMLSCTKSGTTAPMSTTTDSLASNFDYITSTTWMYSKYYIGYTDSTNLGTLVFDRTAGITTTDLTNDFDTFYPVDSVGELYNGSSIPGIWGFVNNAQTQMFVTNSVGSNVSTILKADYGHFNWTAHVSDGTTRYAEMIPKK